MGDGSAALSLDGQVAIITGASRGIGRAISVTFARAGASVVLAARTESDLTHVAQEIRKRRPDSQTMALRVDVADERDVERMIEQALERFGRVDILVNNAGVWAFKSVQETSVAEWDRMMETNLRGVFLCAKAVLRPMIQQQSGQIINISSAAGKRGYGNMAAYCASKFGVTGFTEALAEEVQPHNIRVVAICPGAVANSRYEHDPRPADELKMLSTEDIAQLALYLAAAPSRVLISEIVINPRV